MKENTENLFTGNLTLLKPKHTILGFDREDQLSNVILWSRWIANSCSPSSGFPKMP